MQESETLSAQSPHTGEALISARSLVKRFGDFTAVDGIEVEVHRGESFGFLGPNGAGKSSTMRMIGCVSPVTEGELRIFGMDPARDGKQIRARIGVVPQQDQLDEQLSVIDNLILYGRYFDLPAPSAGAAPRTCWSSCSCPTGRRARSSRCRVA